MRVKEIDHGLTLAAPTEGYVRTPGLHASDLYNAFYKAFDPKRYDKKDAKGQPLPFDLAKMELGTSFEEVLEAALVLRLFGTRPGEFRAPHADGCMFADIDPERIVSDHDLTQQGVCPECGAGTLFSPDYLFDIGDELMLGEFKCTWYSSKGAPFDPKFSKWITQIKLYLYWLGLTKCRLYVFFVNGDYTPPTPQLRCWELTFTRRELIDEHATILRHARKKGLLSAPEVAHRS